MPPLSCLAVGSRQGGCSLSTDGVAAGGGGSAAGRVAMFLHTRMCMCVHVCVCMCACMCVCVCVHVCVHVRVCIQLRCNPEAELGLRPPCNHILPGLSLPGSGPHHDQDAASQDAVLGPHAAHGGSALCGSACPAPEDKPCEPEPSLSRLSVPEPSLLPEGCEGDQRERLAHGHMKEVSRFHWSLFSHPVPIPAAALLSSPGAGDLPVRGSQLQVQGREGQPPS